MTRDRRATTPIIRRAPLPELRLFEVSDDELEMLAQGSPVSVLLNFALFLIPIGLTLIVTLPTTKIESPSLVAGFVSTILITLINGSALLLIWWRRHQSTAKLVDKIRDRMPPPEVRETSGVPGDLPR